MNEYKWMENLNMAVERLQLQACSLERLGTAFYLTGNESMGAEMMEVGNILNDIAEMVRDGKTDALNEAYATTQQGATNLLNMALAMADKEK